MLKIRKAHIDEFEKVIDFYYLLIDTMQDAEYHPYWEKGVYPSEDFIRNSIDRQELYVGTLNDEFAAALVLNHDAADGYEEVSWNTPAAKNEVMVIHALGVLTCFQGQGIAQKMIQEAARIARKKQQKAVRLDVLTSNIPARKLYVKMGFQYIDTVKIFYEDTGLADFMLYEYRL